MCPNGLKEYTCSVVLLYLTLLFLPASHPLNDINFVYCADVVKSCFVINSLAVVNMVMNLLGS